MVRLCVAVVVFRLTVVEVVGVCIRVLFVVFSSCVQDTAFIFYILSYCFI